MKFISRAGLCAIIGFATTFAPFRAGAVTFPTDPTWNALVLASAPIIDPVSDTAGSRDVVGDASNPAAYIYSDGTNFFFRIRVNSDPRMTATNFAPFGWGLMINADADPTTYEYSIYVDGINIPDRILFYKNTATTTPNSPLDSPDTPFNAFVGDPLNAGVVMARVLAAPSMFGGDPDYFIDAAFPVSTLTAAGINTAGPLRWYVGSSNDALVMGGDCTGGPASGCPLDSQFSDATKLDGTLYVAPTATPSPTTSPTPSPTASPTSSATASATASATPSETPSATASQTASATPSATVSPSTSPTPSPTPTETASETPSETPSSTPTETPSVSPTATASLSATPTPSPTSMATAARDWGQYE